jgi:pimeloyl-ACP methyl ester carboxylesterase
MASDLHRHAITGDLDALRERAGLFPNLILRSVPDTGHSVHIDAPGVVAEAVQDFWGQNKL